MKNAVTMEGNILPILLVHIVLVYPTTASEPEISDSGLLLLV